MKIKDLAKNKSFWGYVLTGIGSFLAGTGDLVTFVTGLFGWFN